MTPLPIPAPDALAHSQLLQQHIAKHIQQSGGWIDFAEFMHMALYTPSLGYYSGGLQKFGDMQKGGGDFVTAPQLSPLFAQTIANQIAEVLAEIENSTLSGLTLQSEKLNGFSQTHTPYSERANILELGAGTGQLAADCLLALADLSQLPAHYYIVEVSDHLRTIQCETLQSLLPADIFSRVTWLTTLPTDFVGVILANEVLDALPVHIVRTTSEGLMMQGVALNEAQDLAKQDMHKQYMQKQDVDQTRFVFAEKVFSQLQNATTNNLADTIAQLQLPDDYVSEYCLAANGLVASLAQSLKVGALLLIDYGFSAREYYHPQRNFGTLMCHYQHLAHSNPLVYVGLQDITAHVNFSAIAHAGVENGLALEGICSQAQFLMNCGILDVLSQTSPANMSQYAPLAASAQKLLSPAEMGDLFKVIGFSKQLDTPLMGFSSGDKSHTL